MSSSSRRRFLEVGSMLILSSVGAACSEPPGGNEDATGGSDDETSGGSTSESGEESSESATGSTESSDSSSSESTSETGGEVCEETPPQTAGPFPQAGLERSNFDLYGHAGVALTLRGRLLDQNCEPVANAQVLMWHATPSPPGVQPATPQADPSYEAAVYDHVNQSGATAPDGAAIPTGEQMYYGWVTTDDEGHYEFQTLRPGWYLNGATYRPAHLHFRIYVDGAERLTTQIYFPDDPFNDLDSILVNACGEDACFMEYDDPEGAEATFDLHVAL